MLLKHNLSSTVIDYVYQKASDSHKETLNIYDKTQSVGKPFTS